MVFVNYYTHTHIFLLVAESQDWNNLFKNRNSQFKFYTGIDFCLAQQDSKLGSQLSILHNPMWDITHKHTHEKLRFNTTKKWQANSSGHNSGEKAAVITKPLTICATDSWLLGDTPLQQQKRAARVGEGPEELSGRLPACQGLSGH